LTTRFINIAASAKQSVGHRLARRRFVSSLRPTDVFIVTFPKSGTRWLGFFLASIIAQKQSQLQSSPLTVTDYGGLVHDVNRQYHTLTPLNEFDGLLDPRIFTVHASWDSSLPNVIYLVRDPRAVLVSYYHHFEIVDGSFNRSMSDFISSPPQDWNSHVRSWLEHADSERLLLLRYEDLHADPTRYFRDVADFAHIPTSEVELASAIDRSRFDNMRRVEDLTQDLTKYADPSGRFVRKGKVDSWRDELSPEQIKLIEERNKTLMEQLGYERDCD